MKPVESGGTVKDHLLHVQRQTGKIPKQLKDHELPKDLWYLWEFYFDLKSIGDSVNYTDVYHWSELRAVKLKPFEVDAIIGIELARRRVIHG